MYTALNTEISLDNNVKADIWPVHPPELPRLHLGIPQRAAPLPCGASIVPIWQKLGNFSLNLTLSQSLPPP